jgi:hypothetical protein
MLSKSQTSTIRDSRLSKSSTSITLYKGWSQFATAIHSITQFATAIKFFSSLMVAVCNCDPLHYAVCNCDQIFTHFCSHRLSKINKSTLNCFGCPFGKFMSYPIVSKKNYLFNFPFHSFIFIKASIGVNVFKSIVFKESIIFFALGSIPSLESKIAS